MGHLTTLPSNINKQAGSPLTCSARGEFHLPECSGNSQQSCTTIGLKSNALHYKTRNKDWINYLKAKTNPMTRSLPLWMQQKSQAGGLPHKDSTIISSSYTNNIVALFTWRACHICAQQPQLLPKHRMNMFTPLKKQAIYYHLLILNMMPVNTAESLCCGWTVIFARFNIIFIFPPHPCFMEPSKTGVHSLKFIKLKWGNQTTLDSLWNHS